MLSEEQTKFANEVERKIKIIDSTMRLEGMPLPKEFKETLRNCYYGLTTTEKEREKLLVKCRSIYGK